jgi:branched-chain amino acid aminotransferase
MRTPIITDNKIIDILNSVKNPCMDEYYAFYSSWFGGILQNPRFMLLPIDDHMVHRGDGVFEACKVINQSIYLLDEHLERLLSSAEKIHLTSPFNVIQMKQIICETLQVAQQNDASLRIFLSRGPGHFSVNPYDSIGAQFYVVVTKTHALAEEKYTKGVAIGISTIPIKISWLAQVKSCNYLPNVLMKKETVDRHLDFVIVIDDDNFVAEGATENIMMVNKEGHIIHPPFTNILKGTTLVRACELAKTLGIIVKEQPISLTELQSATEVMMLGTTLDVVPVVTIEDVHIGTGQPGPIAKKLRELIIQDIKTGPKRTPFNDK